jgi:hypothetical protein
VRVNRREWMSALARIVAIARKHGIDVPPV